MYSAINLGTFFLSLTLGFLFVNRFKPKMTNIQCKVILFIEVFLSAFITVSFYDNNKFEFVCYLAWGFILPLGFLHGVVSTHFETEQIPLK